MEKYAGQRKVSNDIDKKLKREKSAKKSNAKKRKAQKLFYYAKLINKNNSQTTQFFENKVV